MSFRYASFWIDHLLPGAHTSRSAESISSCSEASTAFLNASTGTCVAVTGAVRSSSGRTSNELVSNVPLSEKREEREEFMTKGLLSYNGRPVVEICPRLHALGQTEERP